MRSPQPYTMPPQHLFSSSSDLLTCFPLPTNMDSILSSPATDVADPTTHVTDPSAIDPTIVQSKFMLSSTEPLSAAPPFQPKTSNPAIIESFLTSPLYDPSFFLPPTPKAEAQILPINVPPQPQPPPHLQNAIASELSLSSSLLSPFPHASTSPCDSPESSRPHSERSRPQKRKRSLSALRAAAMHNAPDVNLTDAELQSIGEMHESDHQLEQSRQIYSALQQLKHVLAKFDYRVKSLHVEPGTEDDEIAFTFSKSPSTTEKSALSSKKTKSSQCSDENPRPAKRSRHSCNLDGNYSPTRISCVVCMKSVSDMETLVRHFRHTHQDLKAYSCPRCGGFYASESTLWTHISNVHTETPRKYKCSLCDASYDSFGAKTRHEHATHPESKGLYKCTFEDCTVGYKFPAHLENHAAKEHPGFRPFVCEVESCAKGFPSLNGLTRHRREVHERVLVYRCSCGKTHPKRCHLKRHLLNVHKMSPERVKQEMKKQPHPGLLHLLPPGPPAAIE
ncbi:unnamed protein product [Agarophyton chilense]